MAQLFARRPEARQEHARHRREVPALKLKLGEPDAPELPGARGLDDAEATSATSRARGSSARFARVRRRSARRSTRRVPRRASRWELDVICKMKFPGYFLIVWDFIRYAQGARRPGRAGPRLGRRLARRLRAAHHRPRSDPVQPAVRALPESRARVHAGLRRRLLHGPARRRHRVRAAEVRRGRASGRSPRSPSSRPRASSRTSRARHRHLADRGAGDREPHPAEDARPRRTRSPRASRSSPSSRRATRPSRRSRELLTQAQQARGPHAPRRQARRRHRHQRGPALGSRARLQRRQDRRLRHAVLQGRRRAGGPRQVRLPRPQDAHRHRHRACA